MSAIESYLVFLVILAVVIGGYFLLELRAIKRIDEKDPHRHGIEGESNPKVK